MKWQFITSADKKYFFKRFGFMASVIGALIIIAFFIAIIITIRLEKKQIMLEQQNSVSASRVMVEQWLDEAVKDLYIMTNSQYFINYMSISNRTNTYSYYFNDFVASLLKEKKNYNQLRFIDLDGMERFRVDQNDLMIGTLGTQPLQDKSDRYYFKNSISLNKDDIYISPLDLNMEHGKIELPYRPMIRICIAVFENNQKIGVNILNLDATNLLKSFKTVTEKRRGDFLLLNKDGYFLSAPNSDLEWGFMFPEGKDKTFAALYPKEAEMFENSDEGQLETENGVFTYATAHPLQLIVPDKQITTGAKNYSWKIVLYLPHDSLKLALLVAVPKFIFLFVIIFILGLGFSFMFAFVSLRKFQAYNNLKESEEKLRISNQTKDKLFSILAHDLRSPVGSLKSTLELVLSGVITPDDSSFMPLIQSLSRTTDAAFVLLENLLGWSKSQSNSLVVSKSEVKFNEIVESIVALMKLNLSNKNISIEVNVEPNIILFADEQMVHVVVRNLLSNAVKFTPENGLISLSATTNKSVATIRIKDNGVGISEENVKSLFEDHSQIKSIGTNNEYGSGLGLVLCKEFVEKNDGCLSVVSEIGKGSTFIFNLPLASRK